MSVSTSSLRPARRAGVVARTKERVSIEAFDTVSGLRLCRPRPSRPGEVSLLRGVHTSCVVRLIVAIGRSFSSSRNVQRHGIDRASCPHDPAARRRSGIVPSRYSPSTSRTAAGRSSSSRRARAPIRAWERLGLINCFAATNASSSTRRGSVHRRRIH